VRSINYKEAELIACRSFPHGLERLTAIGSNAFSSIKSLIIALDPEQQEVYLEIFTISIVTTRTLAGIDGPALRSEYLLPKAQTALDYLDTLGLV